MNPPINDYQVVFTTRDKGRTQDGRGDQAYRCVYLYFDSFWGSLVGRFCRFDPPVVVHSREAVRAWWQGIEKNPTPLRLDANNVLTVGILYDCTMGRLNESRPFSLKEFEELFSPVVEEFYRFHRCPGWV